MENEKKPFAINEAVLKIIGIVFMTLDHVGLFLMKAYTSGTLYEVGYWFRAFGRIAFPLFVFMIVEGVKHTHSPWKYLLRLGILYGVITAFETIMCYGFPNNVFSPDGLDPEPLTDLFFIALFLLLLRLPKAKKLWAIFPLAFFGLSFACGVYDHFHESNIILWFPRYLRSGYSLLGLAIALGFYFAPAFVHSFYKKPLAENHIDPHDFDLTSMGRRAINVTSISFFVVAILVFWGISYITSGREISPETNMSLETYALLCIPFLYFYNGERGYDGKAFRIATYLYFPVHLAIIYAIFSLI